MSEGKEYLTLIKQLDEKVNQMYSFDVAFIDAKGFRKHIQDIMRNFGTMDFMRGTMHRKLYSNIDVTGYFSEGAHDLFCECTKIGTIVRLLTRREKMGQDVFDTLKTMQKVGVQIKVNDKMHGRLFLSYNIERDPNNNNELVLGSFDFNKEGLTADRRDFGIITRNPDLIDAAKKSFESVWNEPSSRDLPEKFWGT
jgi:hypothetical protein